MTNYNVAVIGAGKIGTTLFHLMTQRPYITPDLADRIAGTVLLPHGIYAKVAAVDATDEAALEAYLKTKQVVVSTAPFSVNRTIATVAARLGIAYFDVTEDIDTAGFIQGLAENSQGFFAPMCGLAPGVISTIAHGLTQPYEDLRSVELRVGALPRYAFNGLKYYLSWSTAGLINQYCNLGDAIHDGQRIQTVPLEGLETVLLDGVEYEAFNTSGGIGTLADSLEGRVEKLNYKSLRYPGHRDAMRVLLDDLNLRNRRDLLAELYDVEVPATSQDMVQIAITVAGRIGGQLVQQTYARTIHGQTVGGLSLSAIQVTTANAVASTVDLWMTGHVPESGFLRQEDITLDALASTPYSKIFLA